MKINVINSATGKQSGNKENIQQLTKRLDNIQKRILQLEQELQNKDYNLSAQTEKGTHTKQSVEKMSNSQKKQLKQAEIENLKAQAEMLQEKIQNLRSQSVKNSENKKQPVYSSFSSTSDANKKNDYELPAALYKKHSTDKQS